MNIKMQTKQNLFNALKKQHFIGSELHDFTTVAIKGETVLFSDGLDFFKRMSTAEYLGILGKELINSIKTPVGLLNEPDDFLMQFKLLASNHFVADSDLAKYAKLVLKLCEYAKDSDIIFTIDHSKDYKVVNVVSLSSTEDINEYVASYQSGEFFTKEESLFLDLDCILWFEGVNK